MDKDLLKLGRRIYLDHPVIARGTGAQALPFKVVTASASLLSSLDTSIPLFGHPDAGPTPLSPIIPPFSKHQLSPLYMSGK